jgi:hypothetical protein
MVTLFAHFYTSPTDDQKQHTDLEPVDRETLFEIEN